MKQVKVLFALLIFIVSFEMLAEDVELVSVKGTGTGTTEELALKDAYRDAIETAVGLYVDAEQLVKNDQLIKDEILTQSNAYIEGYKKLGQSEASGVLTIKILASVRKQKLTKRISGMMAAKTVAVGNSLANLHAKIESEGKRNEDSAKLLEAELGDLQFNKVIFDCSLISSEPVLDPSAQRGRQASGRRARTANGTRVGYWIKEEVNLERYFSIVAPRLSGLMSQISLSQPKTIEFTVAKRSSEDAKSKWLCADINIPAMLKGSGRRPSMWPPDPYNVLLVTGMSDTVFTATMYELDNESLEVVRKITSGKAFNRMPDFTIRFEDERGEPLYSESVSIGTPGMMYHFKCCAFYRMRSKDVGKFRITPWFNYGSDRFGYCGMQVFDLPTETLPKVKSIKISAE